MERYIDADKLIDKIFPIGLIDDGKYTINAKAIKMAIDSCPAADVAPKSEVDKARQMGYESGKRDNVYGFSAEELAQKNEQLAIELNAMRGAYENAKTEVARKLLSDLKKAVHDKAIYTYSKELSPYVNLKVFDAVIAEYISRLDKR